MNRRAFLKSVVAGVTGVATVLLSGCFGMPKGTMKETVAGGVRLRATGAGIVKADATKTTFKIKCHRCGFEPEAMTIDTPTAGKPYTLAWTCPRCGHHQRIVIEAN